MDRIELYRKAMAARLSSRLFENGHYICGELTARNFMLKEVLDLSGDVATMRTE